MSAVIVVLVILALLDRIAAVYMMGPGGRAALTLHPYDSVALGIFVKIARALLDRRSHRSELIPEMRARWRV
jgi:hypothetical protein